jgi:hypothetical protein
MPNSSLRGTAGLCINSGAIEGDEASLAGRCRAFQSERQNPTRDGVFIGEYRSDARP